MKARLIVGIIGFCLAVTFLVFLIFYLRPLMTFAYVKWQARESPEMWLVPTPLLELSTRACMGVKHSYFGYEFKVPWTEVKQERKFESAAILNFSTGAAVMFYDPSRTPRALDVMKQAAGSHAPDLQTIFGDTATKSNYDLRSTVFYLTPRDLSLFSTRQRIVGNSILLIIKSSETKLLKGGLYSFQTDSLRGFQEGSPDKDQGVKIEAFDSDDRRFELFIGSENAANQISQADIDVILCSLRPVPTP